MFNFSRVEKITFNAVILVVVLFLFGTPAHARLTASVGSANFPNQSVGTTSAPIVITFTNTGRRPSTIVNAGVSLPQFSVSGPSLPGTLFPGQSAMATVTFTPSAAQTYSDVLVITDSFGFTTKIALTGTGGQGQGPGAPGQNPSGSPILAASSTSLNFGILNLSLLSSQNVTLTNTGSSDITISNVSVSGAGFSVSNVFTGQVISAGTSATLNVTFIPLTAGLLSGSVVIGSNAINSPLTISLSAGGATVTTGAAGTPICGLNNDATAHIPDNYTGFTAPALGQSYVDTLTGCTITRITDSQAAGVAQHHYYSTLSPISQLDDYVLINDENGAWHVVDTSGNIVVPVSNMPSNNNVGVNIWDSAVDTRFYYSAGNSLMSATITGLPDCASTNNCTVGISTVNTFSEYSSIVFADEPDLSQDGDHLIFVGHNADQTMDVLVWGLSEATKSNVYTTACTASGDPLSYQPGCIHKIQLSPNNEPIIEFASDGSSAEQGLELWSNGTATHLQTSPTGHYDVGFDINGNEVFIEDRDDVNYGGKDPCPSGGGAAEQQFSSPFVNGVCPIDKNWAQPHISYRGGPNQPWFAISFFDARTPGPEFFNNDSNFVAPTCTQTTTPSGTCWFPYESEVVMVRVDAANNLQNIYRIAQTRTRSAESFWSQPHATISRDGKYIIFDSNMAFAQNGCGSITNCSDVFIVQVQ